MCFKFVFAFALLASCARAWSAETAPDAPAVSPSSPTPAGDLIAPPDSSDVAAPSSAPAVAAPPTRDEMASAFLDFMRGASGDGDKAVAAAYLNDLNAYLAAFRDENGADEILTLRAALHLRLKDYPAVAVDWLKLLFEYPDSRFAADAKTALGDLGKDRLRKDGVILFRLSAGPKDAPRPQRYAQLLRGLSELQDDRFCPPLRAEYAEFMIRYPEQPGADGIELLAAQNELLAGEDAAAGYAYQKLLALYPSSPLRPQALLDLGDLYSKRLREYDKGLAAYVELTQRFPDGEQARPAFERIAELDENRYRKHADAVAALEEVVKRAPGKEPALKALGTIAQIYRDRMNMYDQSIKAYERLDGMFKGDPGVSALSDGAYEAGRYLKDYPRQAALLAKLATEYAGRPEAPEAMYDEGGVYEDSLNDLDGAVKVYQDLEAKFPQSKYAAKALKRIVKIQKKLADQQAAIK